MGKVQNSIDAKNRVIIPAKFREDIGSHCVVTVGLENCLNVYPMSTWNRIREKLERLPISDEKARSFIRYYYSNAQEGEPDRQGRLTLSQELLDAVGIGKELVTVGLIDHLEIWNRDEWEGDRANMKKADVQGAMKEYGI